MLENSMFPMCYITGICDITCYQRSPCNMVYTYVTTMTMNPLLLPWSQWKLWNSQTVGYLYWKICLALRSHHLRGPCHVSGGARRWRSTRALGAWNWGCMHPEEDGLRQQRRRLRCSWVDIWWDPGSSTKAPLWGGPRGRWPSTWTGMESCS